MFSFVRIAVNQVMSTITQQINLTEGILGQVRGAIPGIESAWTGDDADAFVQEINSRLVPEITSAIASVVGMSIGIASAVNVIDAADRKARGIVADLSGVFDSIF